VTGEKGKALGKEAVAASLGKEGKLQGRENFKEGDQQYIQTKEQTHVV